MSERDYTVKFLVGTEMRYDRWRASSADQAAEGWYENLRMVADADGFVKFDTGHGGMRVKLSSIEFVEAF